MSFTSHDTAGKRITDLWSRLVNKWRLKLVLITILNLTCFVILWELVTTYTDIPRLFLPKLSLIVEEIQLMHAEGILLPNFWVSIKNYLIGVTIGVLIGLPLAYAIGGIKIIDRLLSPYLWALFSTPRIILLPLIFLWVGLNNNARLALVIITVIPSLVVVVMEGVRTTSPTLLRAARVFGANRIQLFRYVILPSTVPFIGTGIRMAMLRGLIALYIGELFITNNGIGSIIAYASARFRTARVFAVLILFVLLAVTTLLVTRLMEARMSKWRAKVVV